MFDQSSFLNRGEASELIKNELWSIFLKKKNFWVFFAPSAHQQAAENSSIKRKRKQHHPLKLQHIRLTYSTYNHEFIYFILIWPSADVCHVSSMKAINWWPSHQPLQPVGMPLMKYLPVHHYLTLHYRTAFCCLGQHNSARMCRYHLNTSLVCVLHLSHLLSAGFLFLAVKSRSSDFWIQQIIRQTSKGFNALVLPVRATTHECTILVYQLNN